MRAGEGFCKEDCAGMFFVNFRDAPLPEWQRLGMGIVDAEDLYPVLNPIIEDIVKSLPEGAPT
jgi:hypothetical protein